MQTFSNIFNGESGSSVRGKLNNVLTSIISGSEGINAIWEKIESVTQRINGMDSGISHIVKDTSYNPSSLDPYKNAVLIALCTGTFNNIKDKNGTPITIPGSNALTIFYRAANTTYWEYDTQEIFPAVDSYESNDYSKISSAKTHVMTHSGNAIKPMTDFNSVYDLDGNNLTKTFERLHTIVLASMGTAVDNEGNDSDVAIGYVPSVGDRYYDSATGHIKWVKSSTVTEDLGLPSEDRIYCNGMTQRLYVFKNGWKKVGEPNEDLTSLKSNVASNSENIQSIVSALSTKVDKTDITQSTGTSTTAVMSQKAVSDAINKLKNAGYLYAGIATPTTNPGTPDGPVFYIANGKGTYTNFGGIDVTDDEVVILYYDNIWHKEATGIASNDKLTELEEKIEGTGSNYVHGIVVDNLGQEVEQEGWNVSEYIELIPNEDVIWHFGERNNVAKIVTYTADKTRINSFSANDVSGVRTLASSSTEFINAIYIRASFADSVKESNVVEMGSYSWKPIEKSVGIIPELDRKENISNRKSDLNNPNNTTYPTTKAVVEYFAEHSVPQELVARVSNIETILNGDSTESNYIKGKVVTQSGDVIQSGWNATDFIELIPNTDVVWTFGERNSVARLVTYSEDKTVINSFGANVVGGVKTMASTSSEFSGCKYIRASFDDSVKNENIVVMGNYVWKAIDGQKEDGLISEVNAIKTKVDPVIPPIGSYPVWEPISVTDDYKLPIGQGTQGGADFPLTYYGFLNEYFDTYVNQVYSDGYSVKKFGLGDDSSHTGYELYYYEFAPKAYNNTVLLSSGMNACELSGYFGIAYFIKALMEEQEQGMISLKKSTRFVILPCMCPSCVDARPIPYLNANEVRINKNFNYKTSWKNISASVGKGTYPDSEIETRLLKEWINKYNGADLWIDCHADAGSTSGYENTLAMFFCSQDFADFFTYQKFYAYKDFYIAKGYFADRKSATIGVSTNNMLTQYPKTLYAKEVCGIPSALMEQFICSTTYGSDGRTNNDAFGIKHYVATLRYIILLWLKRVV